MIHLSLIAILSVRKIIQTYYDQLYYYIILIIITININIIIINSFDDVSFDLYFVVLIFEIKSNFDEKKNQKMCPGLFKKFEWRIFSNYILKKKRYLEEILFNNEREREKFFVSKKS